MTAAAPDPFDYVWWIAARAAGIIAIVLVSASIGLGLAMATRARRRPGMAVALRRTHQYVALSALVAIAAHGVFLLLDPWLHPSASALVVPFQLGYRPVWTGLGVIAGWMIAVLAVSYWLRDRIGRDRWAAIHRLTVGAYVLALVHVVGSGTDATSRWLLVVLAAALVPVVPLLARRLAGRRPAPPPAEPPRRRPSSATRRRARAPQTPSSAGASPGPPPRR
jgi:methionine sulfoxide reductase heme-binding subunit